MNDLVQLEASGLSELNGCFLQLYLSYYRLYDERVPLEPEYPSTRPSVADFDVDDPSALFENGLEYRKPSFDSDIKLRHAPPG